MEETINKGYTQMRELYKSAVLSLAINPVDLENLDTEQLDNSLLIYPDNKVSEGEFYIFKN